MWFRFAIDKNAVLFFCTLALSAAATRDLLNKYGLDVRIFFEIIKLVKRQNISRRVVGQILLKIVPHNVFLTIFADRFC